MRRRSLLGTLGLGTALWAVCAGQARAWLRPGSGLGTTQLLAVLARPDSAAVVGRAYLAGHPHEADRTRLGADLDQALRCQGCDPAQASDDHLRAALARQIRADFAASRTVRVDGWILSTTEARLCGLAALSGA